MKTTKLPIVTGPLLRPVAVAAVLCLSGFAHAQSSVTLYGIADIGVTSVSGLKAGTATQLASGIMEGSRFGLKGNEDLGGGYRAIFTFENRMELDTGAVSNTAISGTQVPDRLSQATSLGLNAALQTAVTGVAGILGKAVGVNVGTDGNRLFDRQAFVGLVTPFGGFLAGRQYTPAFETSATYDIMQTQSGLAAGQIATFPPALDIRISNSVAYRIVKDGFSGSVMYALGEVSGNSSAGRLVGINGNYKTDAFSVGLGYNTRNNELGEKSLTSTVLGASANLGAGTVSTMLVKIKDDHPSGLSTLSTTLQAAPNNVPAAFANAIQSAYISALKQDATLFHIGYRYVTGPSTISVAFSRLNDKTAANADIDSYGVAYTYALSKRTDMSAVLVHFNNKNTAQLAPGGNGYLGGVTATAGTDSTGVAFGVRHRF